MYDKLFLIEVRSTRIRGRKKRHENAQKRVFLIGVRSTRIRGRKKRHGNLKSVRLAISGQTGYIFSSFFY